MARIFFFTRVSIPQGLKACTQGGNSQRAKHQAYWKSAARSIARRGSRQAEFLPLVAAARIMEPAKGTWLGGCSDAGTKIERSRNPTAVAERQRLERSERQIAPRVRMQGFRRRLRQNDPGGPGGGSHEPSPRVVQRVE